MSFPPPPPRPAAGAAGQTSELLFMQKNWDIHWDPKVNIFVDTPQLKFNKTPKGYVPVLRIPKTTSSESGKSDYAGLYVNGQSYNALQWVVLQTGVAAGAYISTADKNTNHPTTGINWVQFSYLPEWF